MFTVRSYTIGSGVLLGMHGIVLGIGDTGRAGGTLIAVGHMIGTGVTATHSIITITGVRSVPALRYAAVTTAYTAV